jgi:hypothetical protein
MRDIHVPQRALLPVGQRCPQGTETRQALLAAVEDGHRYRDIMVGLSPGQRDLVVLVVAIKVLLYPA